MEKIKSSLEVALQRAAVVEAPDAAKQRELKVKELSPLAKGLAQQYLAGDLPLQELGTRLQKYGEEGQEILRELFLAEMYESLAPEDYAQPLEGILFFQKGNRVRHVAQEIEALGREFQGYFRGTSQRLGETLQKELAKEGIGGSAVKGVKLIEDEAAREKMGRIYLSYQEKIEKLKAKLKQEK